ncbi:MAG: shikimate kinase [Phycisphaerales bacterium]
MHDSPTIVLIGLRGSGKSTLGKRLADELGKPFIDLDDRTAVKLGHQTPGAALRAAGIEAFRDAESSALQHALTEQGSILALGGGTPTAPGATDLIREHRSDGRALVMYLRAEPSELESRLTTSGAPDRPALVGDDPVSEIQTLFDQRDPLYRTLADGVLHAGSCDETSAFAMLKAWTPR